MVAWFRFTAGALLTTRVAVGRGVEVGLGVGVAVDWGVEVGRDVAVGSGVNVPVAAMWPRCGRWLS